MSYLKKRIENILEIEKNRLLIYQLQFAYNKIEKTNLEKTNLEKINDNVKKIDELEKRIFNLNTKKEEIVSSNIFLISKKLFLSLKNKNEKVFLEKFQNLNSIIANKENFKYLNEAFLKLSKKRLNNTKLVLVTSNIKVSSFFDSIKNSLDTTLIVLNEQAITPMSLIKAFILILVGIIKEKFIKSGLLNYLQNGQL